MKADRIEFDVDVVALDRAHPALAAGPHDLVGNGAGIELAGAAREDDGSGTVVVAIGIKLPDHGVAGLAGHTIGLGDAHAEDKGVRRKHAHELDERPRQRLVDRKLHIERAMRLDVLERGAVPARELAQRPDLIDHVVDNLVAASIDLAPAKTLQIVIAGMDADADAVLCG